MTEQTATTERSPQEDLAMIRRLMTESRRATDAGGPFYLLWGSLVLVGLVGTYLSVQGRVGVNPGWIWLPVIGVGWLASFWLGWRRDRRSAVRTLGGRVMAGIWIGGGITMTLLGFGLPALEIVRSSGGILGPIALVMGSCFFASSYVLRSAVVRSFAAAWWLGGLAMFWWTGPVSLLLMGALVLFLEIGPGIWLMRNSAEPGAAAAS